MGRIDHLFVFCRIGAPERQRLVDAGLRIGAQRDHRGQGTRNVCFGFADGYLELIWLASEQDARDAAVEPLGLRERAHWQRTGASPFGICLRPESAAEPPPFAHWNFEPDYLPAGVHIAMARNSGVFGEPMLFQIDRPFTPFGVDHELAAARLASVAITTPGLAPKSVLHDLAIDRLEVVPGDAHLLEITLDDGSRGHHGGIDLRPELPLVLRW